MSMKKINNTNSIESKTKSTQQRNKNRRRSTRNTSFSNGDLENDTKDKLTTKRSRDSNNIKFEQGYELDDAYKDIINVVPSADLNCSPSEVPAPPGTRVNLHGVILHETQGGLIVLNVRWRNKVYSGALINVEKSKWASDRLPSECNGGNKEFQTPPPIKKIKIPTSSQVANGNDDNEKKKLVTSPTTPSKSSKSKPNSKKRNNQDRDTSPPSSVDDVPSKKQKAKVGVVNQNGVVATAPSTNNDGLIECPEPNCGKKYKNKYGLTCHIRKIHNKSESLDESGKENKSESQEDSDSGDDNFVIDERPDEDRTKEVDVDEKSNMATEGSQSEDGEEDVLLKEEMTENEKQIEKLKVEADKARAALMLFKKEAPEDEKSVEENLLPTSSSTAECAQGEPILNKDTSLKDDYSTQSNNLKVEVKVEQEDKSLLPPTPIIQITSSDSPAEVPNSPLAVAASVKSESENYPPRGSSRTIIHEDHINSLNELFAPANNNFHQFSPTLGNLNPQKINQSLTDALSKQQQQLKIKKTLLVSSTLANSDSNTVSTDVLKAPLTPKPSIDFKPVEAIVSENSQTLLPELLSQTEPSTVSTNNVNSVVSPAANDPIEKIEGSEDERSITPDAILKGCNKIFPQNVHDAKPLQTLLAKEMNNPLIKNMFSQRAVNPFEQKLLLEELASKVSANMTVYNLMGGNNSAGNTLGKLPTTSSVPPPIGVSSNILKGYLKLTNIDPNKFPDVVSFLKQQQSPSALKTPPIGKDEVKTTPVENPFPATFHEGMQLKPGSLLEQRLLAQSSGKSELGKNLSKDLFLSRQPFNKEEVDTQQGLKVGLHTEKVPAKSLFMARDRIFDKQKLPSGSLRINPPVTPEERVNNTRTWIPEISKETYFNAPSSSSANFRLPVSKALSAVPSLSVSSCTDNKPGKPIVKRPMQPVAIAPAPGPGQSFVAPSSEYLSPESEKEASQFSRYTLTSDNRLIPSPAENRGRPRKARGKLTQVPMGTPQDTANSKLRSPGEISLSRKPSSSPVIRASVIQGASHPSLDNISLVKSPDREQAHSLFGPTRSYEGVADERYMSHHESKMAAEMQRNMPDKYKALSSPPGMYYNPGPSRSLMSPQNQRPASRSPRPEFSVPRSSPSINPELFRDPTFHHRPIDRLDKLSLMSEHARQKPELLRSPTEHVLMPDGNRKTTLSPHEALQMMEAYKRENRLVSSSARFQMPPNHRPDMGHPHELASNIHEQRRIGPEENEHVRLLAVREHERLLHQAALAQQTGLFRGGTPPSAPPSEQGGHHPNLFLERRDGAFLGPLSSFQARTGDQHKR